MGCTRAIGIEVRGGTRVAPLPDNMCSVNAWAGREGTGPGRRGGRHSGQGEDVGRSRMAAMRQVPPRGMSV